MVSVLDHKLVFGRDQIVSASQASKNFGEIRRRSRLQPQFVSDRNSGIDTVIVSYDEFEKMALELERLQEEQLNMIATQRLNDEKESNAIPLEQVIDSKEFDALVQSESLSPIEDAELFE